MATIEVLGTEPVDVDILVNESDVETVSTEGRSSASFIIKINGVDLDSNGMKSLVRKVQVKENLNASNTGFIEFFNYKHKLENSSLLVEGAEMEIFLGWAGRDVVNYGTFILEEPEYIYCGYDTDIVRVTGKNKNRLLSRSGMKRRSFEKQKDSEIAETIAKEYGLKSKVKDTKVEYDLIVQANMNDYEFLMERAELYGYIVYVQNDVLHFHPSEFTDTGKQILLHSSGDSSDVHPVRISLKTSTFYQALKVKKTEMNWENLDIYDLHDNDEGDSLQRAAGSGYKKASAIVPIQAIWYLIEKGHLQTFEEIQRQVESYSKSSKWIAIIRATTVGLEFVNVGKVLRLKSSSKYNGPYLITECEQSIDATKINHPIYTTTFTLIRSFNKDLKENIDISGGNKTEGHDISDSLAVSSTVGVH